MLPELLLGAPPRALHRSRRHPSFFIPPFGPHLGVPKLLFATIISALGSFSFRMMFLLISALRIYVTSDDRTEITRS